MRFSTSTVLLSVLASLSAAAPTSEGWCGADNSCIPYQTAVDLVNGFGGLMSAYSNASAEAILAPDIIDTSDSVNWLAGIPLGGPTFPSLLSFELGAGSQPPIDFQVINVDAVTCDVIAFRWLVNLVPGYPAIKGINVLYVAQYAGVWKIKLVFAEFNSGLWQQILCETGAASGASCDLTHYVPGPPPS